MNFTKLIGQIFEEQELYQMLFYDIQKNLTNNLERKICLHLYIHRLPKQAQLLTGSDPKAGPKIAARQSGIPNTDKIRIDAISGFSDRVAMNEHCRKIIETKEWIEIDARVEAMFLQLVRYDRSGYISIIWKDRVHCEEWAVAWADEGGEKSPLTPEEIRLGFLELAGLLEPRCTYNPSICENKWGLQLQDQNKTEKRFASLQASLPKPHSRY